MILVGFAVFIVIILFNGVLRFNNLTSDFFLKFKFVFVLLFTIFLFGIVFSFDNILELILLLIRVGGEFLPKFFFAFDKIEFEFSGKKYLNSSNKSGCSPNNFCTR
jgi:hypothetical protein